MRNETRDLYQAYLEGVAEKNNVSTRGLNFSSFKFSVAPSIHQELESIMHEDAGFLSRINLHTVPEQEGEKLGMDITTTIASTTDTLVKDRDTQDPTDMNLVDRYRCEQTNFDTHIRYPKLNMWAKFDDFESRISTHIVQQMARDRLMIGWNGESRVANSDRTANPLLQDVNVGWLKHLETKAPERILTEGDKAPGEIRIGEGGDYLNIDALAMDMINNLIEEWYQEDTGLVCVIGREIFNDKFFDLVNSYGQPTERNAMDIILANKKVGGMPAVRVPFFPSKGIMITRLDNLSIYSQENTLRRTIVDNAKRDRVENYISINEAYVVEDYGMICYAKSQNIVLGKW
jgi:P2 family phage major capsid protein